MMNEWRDQLWPDFWDMRAMLSHSQDMIRVTVDAHDRDATPKAAWSPWQRACHRATTLDRSPAGDEQAALLLTAGTHTKGYCL